MFKTAGTRQCEQLWDKIAGNSQVFCKSNVDNMHNDDISEQALHAPVMIPFGVIQCSHTTDYVTLIFLFLICTFWQ